MLEATRHERETEARQDLLRYQVGFQQGFRDRLRVHPVLQHRHEPRPDRNLLTKLGSLPWKYHQKHIFHFSIWNYQKTEKVGKNSNSDVTAAVSNVSEFNFLFEHQTFFLHFLGI